MAAMIVSACGILLQTGIRASVRPCATRVRRSSSPPTSARTTVGHGEEREDESEPVPDRGPARRRAGTARRRATRVRPPPSPDTTFPLGTVGDPEAGADRPRLGRARPSPA